MLASFWEWRKREDGPQLNKPTGNFATGGAVELHALHKHAQLSAIIITHFWSVHIHS